VTSGDRPAVGADGVRMHVGDAVVARVAAERARRVPGVVALRADLAQALLGLAGSALGQHQGALPTEGVSAAVQGGAAEVSVTVVTRLGHNCRDLAQEVQRAVHAEVGAYTGLDVLVRVTVVDVLLE
jgi:uncharacterized alkaline shock family protein YloU